MKSFFQRMESTYDQRLCNGCKYGSTFFIKNILLNGIIGGSFGSGGSSGGGSNGIIDGFVLLNRHGHVARLVMCYWLEISSVRSVGTQAGGEDYKSQYHQYNTYWCT